MTSDKNPELDLKKILKSVKNLKYKNKYEKYLLIHAKTILKNEIKLQNIEQSLSKLNVHNKLNKLHLMYEKFTQSTTHKAQVSIAGLFILLVLLIAFYLIHEYKLILSNNQLSRFRKTVENSDNSKENAIII